MITIAHMTLITLMTSITTPIFYDAYHLLVLLKMIKPAWTHSRSMVLAPIASRRVCFERREGREDCKKRPKP